MFSTAPEAKMHTKLSVLNQRIRWCVSAPRIRAYTTLFSNKCKLGRRFTYMDSMGMHRKTRILAMFPATLKNGSPIKRSVLNQGFTWYRSLLGTSTFMVLFFAKEIWCFCAEFQRFWGAISRVFKKSKFQCPYRPHSYPTVRVFSPCIDTILKLKFYYVIGLLLTTFILKQVHSFLIRTRPIILL